VDGFSVLDALVTSGFKLHRLERIELLRYVRPLHQLPEWTEYVNISMGCIITVDRLKSWEDASDTANYVWSC
jgi:hypothetical protein